jgi:hypothetical protein
MLTLQILCLNKDLVTTFDGKLLSKKHLMENTTYLGSDFYTSNNTDYGLLTYQGQRMLGTRFLFPCEQHHNSTSARDYWILIFFKNNYFLP